MQSRPCVESGSVGSVTLCRLSPTSRFPQVSPRVVATYLIGCSAAWFLTQWRFGRRAPDIASLVFVHVVGMAGQFALAGILVVHLSPGALAARQLFGGGILGMLLGASLWLSIRVVSASDHPSEADPKAEER